MANQNQTVLSEFLQNSQENTYVGVSYLIMLQASTLQVYLKRGSSTCDFQWIIQKHRFNGALPVVTCEILQRWLYCYLFDLHFFFWD